MESPEVTAPNNTTDAFTLSVTEAAARRVMAVISDNNLPRTAGLRASVTAGGCSGFNYEVTIVEAPQPDDLILERHGARVFVDPDSRAVITGMTIDWKTSMQESRFVFDNPNATGTCGCGVSFSVS